MPAETQCFLHYFILQHTKHRLQGTKAKPLKSPVKKVARIAPRQKKNEKQKKPANGRALILSDFHRHPEKIKNPDTICLFLTNSVRAEHKNKKPGQNPKQQAGYRIRQ
ncbi:hypothetical protein [Desulfobotulus alkaliphilus]|uniref:hypothetical protein n=1 Tax=Desulfobotulus alkaliphilus TaxID=622671 RepID=UPI00119DBAB9|nr:hypothetical protein [Desulfobotulus alkaliphilus]